MKKKSVPIADAFIAASAHSINARVMTNDEHYYEIFMIVLLGVVQDKRDILK